ncbi:unnamed protein product [Ectocarpus sp. CCAP 1310/34]|nr:unnamed protein product [Ectocarpus sp. CCAP 1310/34]
MPRFYKDSVLARTVCQSRQQTTVFEGAPVVSGSAAVLLGDVDNDPQAERELAVGGVDGTLAVFKVGHPTPGPYFMASGLGTLSALGLGKLFLGYGDDQQLIACTEEGVCHIFNIRPADLKWDPESDTGRVNPVWSVPCPKNVTSCCIADIDGDKMQEVVMGTREGGVHVLKIDFNQEQHKGKDEGVKTTEKSGWAGGVSTGDTPRSDVFCSSPAAQSRHSTPTADEPGLERLAQDGDESDATPNPVRGPSTGPSKSAYWEDRKSMETPDSTNAPGVVAADTQPFSLSPHLKPLLELKAQDAVTSLSIVFVPEISSMPSTSITSRSGEGVAPPATAQADGNSDNVDGSGRGLTTCPPHEDRPQGGSGSMPALASRTDVMEQGASAAGVYVAVGLDTGVVEVMRLSSQRVGTRILDLVIASERSDRLSSISDAAAAADSHPAADGSAAGDTLGGGLSRLSSDDRDAHVCLRSETSASQPAAEGGPAAKLSGESNTMSRLRLDRDEVGNQEKRVLPGAAAAAVATATAAGLVASVLCGWHVPADSPSADSWAGRGLVVGFSDTEAGTSPFAETPRTPLGHTSGNVPTRGWGSKTIEGVGAGASSSQTGSGDGRQEALHSFQRLDFEHEEGGTESLFVVCSWSGNTLMFDAEGMPCAGFDAEAHLPGPLTAFVAGDLTTPSGSTGPSLVYLGAEGKVVAYHGLPEQIESATPAQFIPILVKDGSMDKLKDLLTSLANRLQWRSSEQALPLFPSSTPPPDAQPADESECVQLEDGTGSSGPAEVATAAAAANIFSDDEPDAALSLSDAILTRAVLCSSGLVVALGSTARRNERRKSTADCGACSFDDARWRREMRALAEGEGSTITVGEGAAAIDRVLKEMQAWQTRGRGSERPVRPLSPLLPAEPTLTHFPCLRGTLEALSCWGSGPRRDSLRSALKESKATAEVFASPG